MTTVNDHAALPPTTNAQHMLLFCNLEKTFKV